MPLLILVSKSETPLREGSKTMTKWWKYFTKFPNSENRLLCDPDLKSSHHCWERTFIEVMTSDRRLKASRECSKCRNYGTCRARKERISQSSLLAGPGLDHCQVKVTEPPSRGSWPEGPQRQKGPAPGSVATPVKLGTHTYLCSPPFRCSHFTEWRSLQMCSGSEAGSYLRLKDSCITHP